MLWVHLVEGGQLGHAQDASLYIIIIIGHVQIAWQDPM